MRRHPPAFILIAIYVFFSWKRITKSRVRLTTDGVLESRKYRNKIAYIRLLYNLGALVK